MNRRIIRLVWLSAFFFTIVNLIIAAMTISQFTNRPPPLIGGERPAGPGGQGPASLPTATPIALIDVVVAIREIPRGTVITPDMVSISALPVHVLPLSTLSSIEDVVGHIARTDIVREQMILSGQLVQAPDSGSVATSQLARTGSDMAAVLEPGEVGMTLYLPPEEIPMGLQVGDSVDILYALRFVDVDPDFQSILPNTIRFISLGQDPETGEVVLAFGPTAAGLLDTRTVQSSAAGSSSGAAGDESGDSLSQDITYTGSVLLEPSEAQRPRLVAQRSVQDARVLWIGRTPADGRLFRPAATPTPIPSPTVEGQQQPSQAGADPATPTPSPSDPDIVIPITLAVRPQDAVVIMWARHAELPTTLVLRPAQAAELPFTSAVDLDYFMQTYGVQLPGRRTFTLEEFEDSPEGDE